MARTVSVRTWYIGSPDVVSRRSGELETISRKTRKLFLNMASKSTGRRRPRTVRTATKGSNKRRFTPKLRMKISLEETTKWEASLLPTHNLGIPTATLTVITDMREGLCNNAVLLLLLYLNMTSQ
jgi:hypothetical protein